MYIGCHVSIAGGVFNAPERAAELGANAMQIFTRSPQGGKAPELTPEILAEFKLRVTSYGLQEIVVHTPYYINFASENNRIRHGSVSVVRDELERASLLGAKYVMTHLGSAGTLSEREASDKVVEMLSKTLEGYDGSAELLIENCAGAGKIIGDKFSEILYILEKINHPKLNGICIDTQHSFASGYDWRDFETTLAKIDSEIGLDKIKLIHANDSKTEFASRKDRHEHIGKGLIGQEAFKKIVSFAKEKNITMIAETEYDFVKDDIELLKNLSKKIEK
ncbi:MAG: putative endonuclease 4 [Candidatus Moranbacteria bacterium GW2011_GWC2_37_8]|nr:MAG: putative endonuclease 4 [Candidatus Moranbacteria bacterium GW2011_GWC2_37_8]KKQ62318.1 MAG: putative endonuclease 4 [Parcubacteria group bacterium GW2011_GWC1_38_22]KKQ80841.1 MAG: putative endonuclease 4 [Candidatus Moranbacteria bacterium GW2011_GWD2_38_7]